VIYQWAGKLRLGYPLLLMMGEDFVHRLAGGANLGDAHNAYGE
jgi:hypothetical protein